MKDPILAMHVITQGRQANILELLSRTAKYFDVVRVLDGSGEDDTKKVCRGFGVKYYQNKWQDDFAEQHTYLMNCSKVDEWVYYPDDDEIPTVELAESLRKMASVQRPTLYRFRLVLVQDGIQMQSDEWLRQPGNIQKLFHKQAFVYNGGQLCFEGVTHPAINEDELRKRGYDIVVSDHYGFHHKTTLSFITGDLRSGFMNPTYQGISEKLGDELRLRFAGIGVEDWHTQMERMIAGTVGAALEDFFIAYRWHPTLEKWFWFYFLLNHPEKLMKDHPELIEPPDDAILRFFMFIGNRKRLLDSVRNGDDAGTYLYIWHLDIPKMWTERYGLKVKISNTPHDEKRTQDIVDLISLKERMRPDEYGWE